MRPVQRRAATSFPAVGGLLPVACLLAACGRGPIPGPVTPIVVEGETMGTTYRILVSPGDGIAELPPDSPGRAAVSGAVRETISQTAVIALDKVNYRFSTYDPVSRLSRFNAADTGVPVKVDLETMDLVLRSFEWHEETGGAFDPTVGPLVNRWQFGPDRGDLVIPTESEVTELLKAVGPENVRFDIESMTLTKLVDGVRLDLSAAAKGYGVDRLGSALAELGHGDNFVEIGGEIRTRGEKPDGSPWTVAVRNPAAPFDPRGVRPMPLIDAAIATSGNYFNFHEVDGVRYGHTIDPRTGRPVTHDLAAATVIAADCATADAYATALMVMGPTQGYDWAAARGVAAMLTTTDSKVRQTPAFEAWKTTGELP